MQMYLLVKPILSYLLPLSDKGFIVTWLSSRWLDLLHFYDVFAGHSFNVRVNIYSFSNIKIFVLDT